MMFMKGNVSHDWNLEIIEPIPMKGGGKRSCNGWKVSAHLKGVPFQIYGALWQKDQESSSKKSIWAVFWGFRDHVLLGDN